MGIFFLTQSAHGFGAAANYGLGLVLGLTYVVGALAAGPLLRALERRGGLEPRPALLAGALAFALLCLLPWAVPRPWAVFAFAALYSPLSGAFWPVVESYLSGGRHGPDLFRAVGRFNVVWSGALATAIFLLAPLVEARPLDVFLLLALLHASSAALLPRLPVRPGDHRHRPDDAPEGVEPLAEAELARLLAIHRPLLAASYVALFALSPYLPVVLAKLGVPVLWHTPLASVWMGARVATFAWLARWHGWHGRRATAVVGLLALLAGFALVVLSPELVAAPAAGSPGSGAASAAAPLASGASPSGAVDGTALAALVLGLLAFGAGAAALYTTALAYVLEHGAAEVDAGGSHEALIGAGYALGPLSGLAVLGAVQLGALPADRGEAALAAVVATLVLGAAAQAFRR